MSQAILVIIVAITLGGGFLCIFLLGEWWGKKRRAEFFSDRHALEAVHGPRPLTEVDTAHCVWLSGQKTFRAGEGLEKITKLILPNPEAESVKRFEKDLADDQRLCEDIKHAIERAENANIDVKLYPEFIGQSWWIGNRDGTNPFVHIECLIPYSKSERRPSFRVYRWQDEEFYKRYRDIFDAMWEVEQPKEGNQDK